MAKNNTKKDGSAGTAAAVGAGVLALAAASYFFFGPEGKKNRHSLRGWMVKMKGEVLEKMENAKEMTQPLYDKMVDTAAMKYAKAGRVSEKEVRVFADVLKQQWQGIVKSHNKAAAVKKAAKVVVKKVKSEAKKVVKKAPAKKKVSKK
jgi:hypothetical protein